MITEPIPRESFRTFSRYRKATALAAVLRDFHTPADVVMQLTPQRRRQVETIAGVRVSSDTTWGVVAILLHQEQGIPITTRPLVTVAEIHEAIKGHAEKHAGRA